MIDYEPTELVITARCGTPLAEIEALLARHQQMLAFEPPHFGSGATLGGMVASGLSGPSRQAVGSLRDSLGSAMMAKAMCCTSAASHENVVATMCRVCWRIGTLGLILEASSRLPRPLRQQPAFDDRPAVRSESMGRLACRCQPVAGMTAC